MGFLLSKTENELEILTGENPHPNLMKIKGFCFQEALAVVYDEKPTMFLWELLHFGTDFRLRRRIYVATQLASLFSWLHQKQFTVRAINLSDIMIDEDFNIKVFDFNYLAPVREDNKTVYPLIYHVYPDSPEYVSGVVQPLKADVYMFCVLLVELFAKIKKIPTPHYCWIQEQLQGGKKSIVNKSLLQDDDDDELMANSITTIAAKCLDRDPDARTGMKNVSDELSKLLDGARRERGTKRKAGS